MYTSKYIFHYKKAGTYTKKFKKYLNTLEYTVYILTKLVLPFLSWNFFLQKEWKKKPAYGRQSISQPMRIIAPMPKNPANNLPIL